MSKSNPMHRSAIKPKAVSSDASFISHLARIKVAKHWRDAEQQLMDRYEAARIAQETLVNRFAR